MADRSNACLVAIRRRAFPLMWTLENTVALALEANISAQYFQ
jgi:hypothetical protein